MPVNHNIFIGQNGESIAEKYLMEKGYEVIERNFRFKRSEIDLIVKKKNTLVFVEVKTRTCAYFGLPEEAITPRKSKAVLLAAEYYLDHIGWNHDIRFDVISIIIEQEVKINHFEDAFF